MAPVWHRFCFQASTVLAFLLGAAGLAGGAQAPGGPPVDDGAAPPGAASAFYQRPLPGQAGVMLQALERALEGGADCGAVLQQIAAIRGAVTGLMSEVLEAHIREEFGQPAGTDAQRQARIEEMTGLVRSYLK